MGTVHRRRHVERAGRITPTAIAAFRAGDRMTLHRELRLPPGQVSPLDAHGDCPWSSSVAGGRTWPESVALRAALREV
jgi:hypothetical protein